MQVIQWTNIYPADIVLNNWVLVSLNHELRIKINFMSPLYTINFWP